MQLPLVELVEREREREPVAVAERARGLVPQARELAHVVGDGRADGLRRLPGLAPLGDVVALAQDPLDPVVVHLLAADDGAMPREARLDRGLELDDARAERVRDLARNHQGVQQVEAAGGSRVGAVGPAGRRRRGRRARGRRGRPSTRARPRPLLLVLRGRLDVRVPPGEVARVVERPQPLDGRIDEVAHLPRAYLGRAMHLSRWKSTTFLHMDRAGAGTLRVMRRSLGPLLCELHAHTRWSDGDLDVAELRRSPRPQRLRRPVRDRPRRALERPVAQPNGRRALRGRERPGPRTSPTSSARPRGAWRTYGLLVLPGLELTFNDEEPVKAAHAVAVGLRELRLRRSRDRGGHEDGRPGRRRGHRGAPVPRGGRAGNRGASAAPHAALLPRSRPLRARAPVRALQPRAALRLGRGRAPAGRRVRRLPPAGASRRLEDDAARARTTRRPSSRISARRGRSTSRGWTRSRASSRLRTRARRV